MTNIISSHDRLSPQMSMSSDLIFPQHQSDEVKLNTSATNAVALVNMQLPLERLEIVHATNGRVRIRASEAISNSEIKNISQRLRQQYGVKEVVANEQTGSIILTFDEKKLLLPQVLGLLQQLNIHPSQVSPTSNSQTDPFAAWKSLNFWKEQSISFIPLFTGLAVTGGLGISGLVAIPVYMITADATRWVIDSLEAQASGSESLQQLKGNPTNTINSWEMGILGAENQEVQDLKGKDLTTEGVKIAYSVVHTIAGRIRFHLPRLAQDRAYGKRLERLIKNDPQTIAVRINYSAASIAIAYKPGEINIAHWVNLMELALQTNPPSIPINAIEEKVDTTTVLEETTLDISSLWADLKPATMTYSLAFIANFPL